jgi:hypothetical protein
VWSEKGMRGKLSFPSFRELHFRDFDALIRTDFYAAHATNALSCLIRISLAVGTHLINLNRADVYAFSTAGAAILVDID